GRHVRGPRSWIGALSRVPGPAAGTASAAQRAAFLVGAVVADQEHDAVDQGPDAEATAGEQLGDADADGTDVETTDAQGPQEELEDAGDDLRLVRVGTALRVHAVRRLRARGDGHGGAPGKRKDKPGRI